MKKAAYLILFLVFALWSETAGAHGGGKIQLENEVVGSCFVSLWLNPTPRRANDTLHITVGISDSERAPVLNSSVHITILSHTQIIQTVSATTDQSVNRLFYEADLSPLEAGDYEVQLDISRPNCEGTLSFPMEVNPASFRRLYLLGAALLFALLFGWHRGQRPPLRASRPLPTKRGTGK